MISVFALRSYCASHWPLWKRKGNKLLHLQNTAASCKICHELIDTADMKSFICCHCCRTQSVFHRTCAMRLAFHKGERLECPVCGAGKKFRKALLPIRMDTQQHVRLDGIRTLPNSLLQMVKITDRFLIHLALQMAPEEKVQGREIWGSWCPLNRSPSPYPTSRKLCIQPLACT